MIGYTISACQSYVAMLKTSKVISTRRCFCDFGRQEQGEKEEENKSYQILQSALEIWQHYSTLEWAAFGTLHGVQEPQSTIQNR